MSSLKESPVIAVLVELNKGKEPAWPPPGKIGDAATFVPGSSADELCEKLSGVETPLCLLRIPGVAPVEVKNVLDRIPSIGWVHSFSAGIDTMAPHVEDYEGSVTNGRGAFSSSLAEYVMTASLHFNKQLTRCAENARNKRWETFTMNVLEGKTMGFLGYGHIAKRTAALARAFGMRTIACRRSSTLEDNLEKSYTPDERLKVMAESDFVVCTLPGTAETLNFCGPAEFAAMKQSGIFISIGRGAAVDEDALCAALSENRIGGAAVDVFKEEPLPTTSPLWNFGPDKLLFTAHNADMTEDYFVLGWNVWYDNFKAAQRAAQNNESVVEWATPVDVKRGY